MTRSSSSAPASTGCRSPSSWRPVRCAAGACPSCAAASTTPRTTCQRDPAATNHGTARWAPPSTGAMRCSTSPSSVSSATSPSSRPASSSTRWTSLLPLLADVEVDLVLASLVDKSLVVRQLEIGSYRLLETIRAFALERLAEHGEHDAAFEHHRRWAVASATAATKLDRWMSGRLAARQRAAAADTRQAFWSSIDAGHVDDAVELAVARSFLWRNAVGCVEGHRWLDALAGRDLEPRTAPWVALLTRRHRPGRRRLPDDDRRSPARPPGWPRDAIRRPRRWHASSSPCNICSIRPPPMRCSATCSRDHLTNDSRTLPGPSSSWPTPAEHRSTS